MSGRPSISVVITCHNYGRFLPEALSNVAAQTYPADQVILVDDGSTDGSADIARKAMPGIVILSQARAGIAGARNTGLAAATGDLIAMYDADDLWPADSLAVRVAAIEANPTVAGSFGLVEQFLCPTLADEARGRLVCPVGRTPARLAGSLLVRTEAAARVGPYDTGLAIGEMMEWLGRFAAFGMTFAQVDALVLRRRIHDSNTMRGQTDYSGYLTAMRAVTSRRRAVTQARAE